MSNKPSTKTEPTAGYWAVVEQCLHRFHGKDTAEAHRMVVQLQKKVDLLQPESARELFYHAEPFDVACDLAQKQLDIGDVLPEYVSLREGLLTRPGQRSSLRPTTRRAKRA